MNEINNMVLPYKDKLYRYAMRYVSDPMEAEDIVQEVLIKIWKKKDHFIQLDNPEAWCMTITRNLSIDKLRKKKAKTDPIEDYHHLRDRNMDPYTATRNNDTLSAIHELIEQLPKSQQAVIHLRDVEGFKYKEIAEITGTNIDSVKVNLHRARKTLKEKILKAGIL